MFCRGQEMSQKSLMNIQDGFRRKRMRTNFSMQEENITLVRGDTLSFGIQLYGEGQHP